MSDTLRAAAQQALEALENAEDQLAKPYSTDASNAITALRAALAEPTVKDSLTVADTLPSLDRADWLADKLHNGGDYGKEAAALLMKQAREIERLTAALAAAVAAERERCARLCEGMHQEDGPHAYAWAIRTEWAADAPVAAAVAGPVDPSDPGYDVDVLREHVRHLERRVRELHTAVAEPVPSGFKMVPVEPTPEMAKAGCYRYCAAFVKDYKAMLSAAPAAPPQREPLTDAQIEDCIDASNRAFNIYRSSGPIGQQITTMDDWKYWLARAIERAHGITKEAP